MIPNEYIGCPIRNYTFSLTYIKHLKLFNSYSFFNIEKRTMCFFFNTISTNQVKMFGFPIYIYQATEY